MRPRQGPALDHGRRHRGKTGCAMKNRVGDWFRALTRHLPFRRAGMAHAQSIREVIVSAIQHRAILRVRYEGQVGYLEVEPHGFGRDVADRLVVLCFEPGHTGAPPSRHGWHRLALSKMVSAFPNGQTFTPRLWPAKTGLAVVLSSTCA